MNCNFSEKTIALYIEGDLQSEDLAKVESHLQSCETCRGVAEELAATQSAFRNMMREPVNPALVTELRDRVLADVAGVASTTVWGRRVERFLFQGFRRYGVAGAAFLVAVCAGLSWYAVKPVPNASSPVVVAPLPAIEKSVAALESDRAPDAARNVSRHQRTKSVRVPSKRSEPKAQETVVQFFTDDPNVIIYWLIDENGGSL